MRVAPPLAFEVRYAFVDATADCGQSERIIPMTRDGQQNRAKNRISVLVFAWIVLLGATLSVRTVSAQTYISAEPIPSVQIVGTSDLAKIEGLAYSTRALWGERLLRDCGIVQSVILALSDNRAISTITPGNTRYGVAAGGFQGVTDPSYVFRIEDSGPNAASAADIFVLDNALGYVLNQGGTAQFGLSYNPSNPYTFSLAYAIVTFQGHLTGEEAQRFFNYLGTIDPALWTGTDAGFTQIALRAFGLSNSMLFLIGNVSTNEFTSGIYKAVVTSPRTTYSPLENGIPGTLLAGAAFPGNDWTSSPSGQGYLSNLVNPSISLLNQLAALRQEHLQAVRDLLQAIKDSNVGRYLSDEFRCPGDATVSIAH
jgi:hypothetical protein